MMKIFFLLIAFFIHASSWANENAVSKIYDQWLAQPEKDRAQRLEQEEKSRAEKLLAQIMSKGKIISSGEGPEGRSHTFLINYNGFLFTCYFEILGTGKCKKVIPVQ